MTKQTRATLSIGKQLAILLALIGVAAGLFYAREHFAGAAVSPSGKAQGKSKTKSRSAQAVPVIVARIGQARNDEIVTAVGTARARRSVMLHPKTDGTIMAFERVAGDRVRRGDTIFELDKRQAQLAVEIAQKKVVEARRLLKRFTDLNRNKVVSNAKVDDARVVAERAELELKQAERTLSDLVITAPFDGVLGLPKFEIGDRVAPDMAVASLDMRAELLVEFDIPERVAVKIRQNAPIKAETPSFARRKFAGRIEQIDTRVDQVSRTVKLRAVIPNPDDVLRPGMSFAVEIALTGKTYPVVPELALQWRKGESFIWLVRDGKAVKTLVTTIRRRNGDVLVDGDVKAGAFVIAEGVQRLRPGRPVTFAQPDEQGSQPDRQTDTPPKVSGSPVRKQLQ